MQRDLLDAIDAYLDAVPRSAARAEDLGPFRLFVRETEGWPYYARPIPGKVDVTPEAVSAVRARQRELGIPETFEWVCDLVPMEAAAAATGLSVLRHPLLVLDRLEPAHLPEGFQVRWAREGAELAAAVAVAEVGFAHPGTARGPQGPDVAGRAQEGADPVLVSSMARRAAAGLTVVALVVDADGSAVATGAHQPVDGATEIVGVATLPSVRRRGLGAALTTILAADAADRGCDLVFLSAGSDEVARVYERAGFRRVGTAGAAEPPASPSAPA